MTNHSIMADKGLSAAPSVITSDTTSVMHRWMRKSLVSNKKSFVSANQHTSLCAMIAYIASKTGRTEFRIERDLSDHYGVPNVSCLNAKSFDSALCYLADIMAAQD